jgi:hypothetical protein
MMMSVLISGMVSMHGVKHCRVRESEGCVTHVGTFKGVVAPIVE